MINYIQILPIEPKIVADYLKIVTDFLKIVGRDFQQVPNLYGHKYRTIFDYYRTNFDN